VNLTAVLHHPNVGDHAYPHHRAEQELARAFFLSGQHSSKERLAATAALPLGQVDALVRSEVCEVMAGLFARGKE
jgi:hypothetical protein